MSRQGQSAQPPGNVRGLSSPGEKAASHTLSTEHCKGVHSLFLLLEVCGAFSLHLAFTPSDLRSYHIGILKFTFTVDGRSHQLDLV